MTAVPRVEVPTDEAADRLPARQLIEQVHALHGQQLYGFVRRQGLDDEEAEDVVQEAMLRLWRASGGADAPRQPVAWVFRTAYRLAMDRHRVRRRWLAFLGRDHGRADGGVGAEDRLAIWTEVDRLPVRQRQVLYLRYRADLAFEDIGAILGIDTSSARSAGSRAIGHLRERFAEEAD